MTRRDLRAEERGARDQRVLQEKEEQSRTDTGLSAVRIVTGRVWVRDGD